MKDEIREMSIEEAVSYQGEDAVVHFMDFLKSKEASAQNQKKFHCEFPVFDAAIDGLATGEVIVITGHRKEGKTTFAESWMRSMLKLNSDAKSLVLSYEMPPVQLLQKYKDDPKRPIYLPMSLKTADFEWLKKRCFEAKFKYGANIILIDHLDHMVDMAVRQSVPLNIGAFLRRLKVDIAMKLNLAVLLVAHQGQPKDDREPSVDTLRGSSSIGQESDATIVVMRRENLNATELRDFTDKYGGEKAFKVSPEFNASPDDKASAHLAIVKVDCHRRTGVWKWKKMFRKYGEFLEEI